MFNVNADTEKKSYEFNGFYRGEVVDNNDPLKVGRCKVKVFSVFDKVSNDIIPWATFADPFMGGFGNTGGSFIPEVGAHVFVFFEGGDHRFPVFFAGAPAISGGTSDLPSESQTNYPHNKVIKTKNGIIIELNDDSSNKKIHIHHPSGTDLLIDNTGNMTVTINGDQVVNISGNSSITVSGNTAITSTGPMTLTGSTINLN